MRIAVTTPRILLACAGTVLLQGIVHAQDAKPGENPRTALVETAEQTYRLLLEDYRSGKAPGPLNLELLNNWSKRVVLARTQTTPAPVDGTSRTDLLVQAHNEHIERMRALRELVQAMEDRGKATAVEVAAARFFRLEGDALLSMLNAIGKAQQERELKVVLPSASEAGPLTARPKLFVVHISRDGRYRVSGRELDSRQIEALLRQAATHNPSSQSVLIRGHEETPFKHVAHLMGVCRKAGIADCSVSGSDE